MPASDNVAAQSSESPSPPEADVLSSERETFPLTIEKLVYGGDGLARHENGEVLFVPWSVPGDQVRAVRFPGNHRPARAQVESLLQPSTDRVMPRCDVFGVCGGCQWQHVSLDAQRAWKRRIVEESLGRIGSFKDVNVNPVWGSDEESWRYRNRVQWDLSLVDGLPRLGYSQAQSHDIVAFADCHIIPEDLNALHDDLTRLLQSGNLLEESHPAHAIRRIEACRNPDGECLLSVYGSGRPLGQSRKHYQQRHFGLRNLAAALMEERSSLKGVVYFESTRKKGEGVMLAGKGALTYRLAGHMYRVSAGSFFQTNTPVAEEMLRRAADWLPENTGRLLDLYAGVGTFAIALHEKARQVLAIESAGASIEDARENVRLNRAGNVTLRADDVDRALSGLETTPETAFEAAILDPPRSGVSPETLRWLDRNITERILYVSCNPTTLARDLKILGGLGWRIESVQPMDMFPHTYHVETLVRLTREG
jgi:23S rRNA (uracil1939-C5)-methyltransferase